MNHAQYQALKTAALADQTAAKAERLAVQVP
jgi:hypothetical protein